MSEMTLDRLRNFYGYATAWNMGDEDRPHMVDLRNKLFAEFDTVLAAELRKAKAEALREAASAHESTYGEHVTEITLSTPASRWLRARADEMEGEQG